MVQAVLASLAAGLATGVGAIPLLFVKEVPTWGRDALLGFAAGVMLGAAFLSLFLPALQSDLWFALAGLLLGALALAAFEAVFPSTHRAGSRRDGRTRVDKNEVKKARLRRSLVIAAAVALHNLPEGFAVGVGHMSGFERAGMALAVAMGTHNIPEGLVVGTTLLEEGISRWKILVYATLTGLVEPLAAVAGVLLLDRADTILPFSLAFAAGAMFYVVSDELIPESHGHGYERLSTFGVIAGIILMAVLV